MSIIKIKGTNIFFSAVESLRYDVLDACLIIRTVSGKEYRKNVETKEQAEEEIIAIIRTRAIHDDLIVKDHPPEFSK